MPRFSHPQSGNLNIPAAVEDDLRSTREELTNMAAGIWPPGIAPGNKSYRNTMIAQEKRLSDRLMWMRRRRVRLVIEIEYDSATMDANDIRDASQLFGIGTALWWSKVPPNTVVGHYKIIPEIAPAVGSAEGCPDMAEGAISAEQNEDEDQP